MHPSVMAWIGDQVRSSRLSNLAVLEVGSYDENGSVRRLFRGPYLGIDSRPGPGVDTVMDGNLLQLEDESVDVVVSTEMLEHDRFWWRSVEEMGRVLRPGGHLLLTTRSPGFPRHDYPADYWRFMPDSAAVIAALALCHEVLAVEPDPETPGLFLHARKPEVRSDGDQ
jgi:SAM-dependent methyltransferase